MTALCPYAPAIIKKHLYQGPRECLDWTDSYDLVVSAAKEVRPPPGSLHVKLEDVRTDWRNWPEFQDVVLYAAEEVANEVDRGGRVLVVCASGWNRSGLIVGLALRMLGMPADEAVDYVRAKRSPQALSNLTFADAVESMNI